MVYALGRTQFPVSLEEEIGNIHIIEKEKFLDPSIAERDFSIEKNVRIESISCLFDNELLVATKDDIGGICTIYYIKNENIAEDHKI